MSGFVKGTWVVILSILFFGYHAAALFLIIGIILALIEWWRPGFLDK